VPTNKNVKNSSGLVVAMAKLGSYFKGLMMGRKPKPRQMCNEEKLARRLADEIHAEFDYTHYGYVLHADKVDIGLTKRDLQDEQNARELIKYKLKALTMKHI